MMAIAMVTSLSKLELEDLSVRFLLGAHFTDTERKAVVHAA
jgi:hypothetical protein